MKKNIIIVMAFICLAIGANAQSKVVRKAGKQKGDTVYMAERQLADSAGTVVVGAKGRASVSGNKLAWANTDRRRKVNVDVKGTQRWKNDSSAVGKGPARLMVDSTDIDKINVKDNRIIDRSRRMGQRRLRNPQR